MFFRRLHTDSHNLATFAEEFAVTFYRFAMPGEVVGLGGGCQRGRENIANDGSAGERTDDSMGQKARRYVCETEYTKMEHNYGGCQADTQLTRCEEGNVTERKQEV